MAVVVAITGSRVLDAREARPWLREHLGLSSDDLTRAGRGTPVAAVLDSEDEREVALVGLAPIQAAPDDYLRRLRDIVRFKRSDQVEAIGVFSASPSIDDLARLELLDDEVRALRTCVSGDCPLQVSQSMLDATRRIARARGAPAEYTHAFREALLGIVEGYRRTGLAALPTYVDGDRPVDVGTEARRIVEDEPRLLPRVPEWRRRLLEPPSADGDITSFVYWSRERMGRASVVSVTHVLVGPAEGVGRGVRLAASLQLYASHYFDASLGLTLLWPEEAGSLLAYYNRSRLDTFEGWFGGMVRRMVRSRAEDAVRRHLASVQQRLRARPD